MSSAKKKIIFTIALFCLVVTLAKAQTKAPVETRNAALRYWLAFADLQDPPSDKATTDLLEKTAAGETAWDETKLGPILDKNETAIQRMQRATKLTDCDWGLEYDLGPRASIAYMPRARVLARLNTLYGMRLAAKGDTQKAVDTLLAGIRFSQHLARGGSLIFSLTASRELLSDFRALTAAAQNGSLNESQRKQIETVVKALPETGFDWGQAFWYDVDASVDKTIEQMAHSKSSSAYYEELMGAPAPSDFSVPTTQDVSNFHKLAAAAEDALRQPPDKAQDKLKELQNSITSLHSFFRQLTPSLTRVNDSRAKVREERQKLLAALSTK